MNHLSRIPPRMRWKRHEANVWIGLNVMYLCSTINDVVTIGSHSAKAGYRVFVPDVSTPPLWSGR